MFKDQDDLPESSPLKNINIEKSTKEVITLKSKQEKILMEITYLLEKYLTNLKEENT